MSGIGDFYPALEALKQAHEHVDREREFYSYLAATVIVNLRHDGLASELPQKMLEWLEGEIAAHNAGAVRAPVFTEIRLAHETFINGIRYEAGTYRIQRIGPPPRPEQDALF